MEDSDDKKQDFLTNLAGVCVYVAFFFGKQAPVSFLCAVLFRKNEFLFNLFNVWFFISGSIFAILIGVAFTIDWAKH